MILNLWSAYMAATNGDDVLVTFEDGEKIRGLPGNDILNSAFNDTFLYGNDGDDQLTTKFSRYLSEASALAAWQYGGNGNDLMTAQIGAASGGGSADIKQFGGSGDDTIKTVAYIFDSYHQSGTDLLTEVRGGNGNDTIDVDAGLSGSDGTITNRIFGDAGDDTIRVFGSGSYYGYASGISNIVDGGSGDDIIEAWATGASNGGDVLHNILNGGYGDDVLKAYSFTGTNSDTPSASHELYGGGGHDTLESYIDSSGEDAGVGFNALLDGGAGNDTLLAQTFARAAFDGSASVGHTLVGGVGNDTMDSDIVGEANSYHLIANMSGGSGSDTLNATIDLYTGFGGYPSPSSASNTLTGEDGNDALDAIITFAADDLETDADLSNVLNGGKGTDTLHAEIYASTLYSFAIAPATYSIGSNQLYGGLGNDVLSALIDTQSFDTMISLVGSSELYGEEGNDSLTVFGGSGNLLDGGIGNDVLMGGDGQDTLVGGRGSDILTGGLEADTFLFDVLEPSYRKDTITDFVSGEDTIALSRSAFAAFASDAAGLLDPTTFATGSAATTTSQHIVYNSGTGALFYDADGAGGINQVQVAAFTNGAALSASDFVLI